MAATAETVYMAREDGCACQYTERQVCCEVCLRSKLSGDWAVGFRLGPTRYNRIEESRPLWPLEREGAYRWASAKAGPTAPTAIP